MSHIRSIVRAAAALSACGLIAALAACSGASKSSSSGPARLGAVGSSASAGDAAAAKAMFERFKSLAGEWEGTSVGKDGGQPERLKYEVVADGSAVMETCHHGKAVMITMYHLDGDRLMLTHYCMAKNQPRMRAAEYVGGNEVTFVFFDGTNLANRDQGHMDKAWFKFIDADHFNSNWTWYQDGKEQWMEQFGYTRVK